ncbi:hypothetical protein GUJ93_ZPchr0002g25878 [Zizania palustris]|nr:hypothetical protein GUJ93_ZPchr0002g25878 [Zizania palustris]
MYAEIPGAQAEKFKEIIEESKIYTFTKFVVVPSKPAYKPFPNKYMLRFTPWTQVSEEKDVPDDFLSYVYTLVPFLSLSSRVGLQEYFTGMVLIVLCSIPN